MQHEVRRQGRGVTLWLRQFIDLLFTALIFAIIARALLSWFNLGPGNPLVRVLNDVTEPILAPLRRVIPTIGMIDITPLVAILLLEFVQRILKDFVLMGIR
ncbi:MAG TPA: YggT family protein [Chloroflexota bacterium]|nr:YggT family protein [Chloroflexota bacterium]